MSSELQVTKRINRNKIIDVLNELVTEKLKPCPFCGHEFDLAEGLTGFGKKTKAIYIVCLSCGARTPIEFSIEDVVKAWNRRTNND